jgi:hypothetical protein
MGASRPAAVRRTSAAQAMVDPFGTLPAGLRAELLETFFSVTRNFRESRWEPSELNGGKLCEVVYSILAGYVSGQYPARAKKPANMVNACRDLEKAGGDVPHSVRVAVPRVLIALYDIRNNRGVGHVGGDVSPNHMDASVVLSMSKWLMAEMVRLLHDVQPAVAAEVIEALIDRELPLVWQVAGRKRVLDPLMKKKDKALAFLYSEVGPLSVGQLAEWLEQDARYVKRDVVKPLHDARLVEFYQQTNLVHLSPIGVRSAEKLIGDSAQQFAA